MTPAFRHRGPAPMPGAAGPRATSSPGLATALFSGAESAVTAMVIVVCMAACGATIAAMAVPPVDDAGISLAFGWSFWTGEGFRLTPESAVVEGFSNPVWTLISGWLPLVTDDPEGAAAALGTALGIASLPIWALWGPCAAGRALRIEDALAPALGAASTSFGYWCAAALESGSLSLLLAIAGALLLIELRRGSGSASGIAFGLVCISRPEAPMYAVVAGVLLLGHVLAGRRRPARHELAACGWVLALGGAWLAFRVATFAAILPNTYYAKYGVAAASADYLFGFARAFPTTAIAALAGTGLGVIATPPERRAALLGGGFLIATAWFSHRAGGDWMREWRFLAPFVPVAGVVMAAALSSLRRRAVWTPGRDRGARHALAVLPVAAVTVAIASAAWDEGRARIVDNRESPTLGVASVRRTATLLAAFHEDLGLVRPRIAVPDVGGVGLGLRSTEIVDVGALCDAAIARTFHTNPAATEDYLLSEGLPTLLDAHGPSSALLRMRELLTHYAPITAEHPDHRALRGLWVVRGLTGDEDPRCEGGLARVRALSPDALSAEVEGHLDAMRPDLAIALYRCAREHREVLPDEPWHARIAARAAERGERLAAEGAHEPALRHLSLATILSHQDPWLRRRTEALRERVYPPSEGLQRRWL